MSDTKMIGKVVFLIGVVWIGYIMMKSAWFLIGGLAGALAGILTRLLFDLIDRKCPTKARD